MTHGGFVRVAREIHHVLFRRDVYVQPLQDIAAEPEGIPIEAARIANGVAILGQSTGVVGGICKRRFNACRPSQQIRPERRPQKSSRGALPPDIRLAAGAGDITFFDLRQAA
jgi:hypothetical protein